MNASLEEIGEAARRVLSAGEGKLFDRMNVLDALRYGTKELFAERFLAVTTEEILRDSPHYELAVKMAETRGVPIAVAWRVVLDGAEDELIAEVMGKEIGERQKLTRRLTVRFGPLPVWASEKIAAAGTEFMEPWGVKLPTAKSLEESLS